MSKLCHPPRLAFAMCGWRWQNDVHEIKYSVCVCASTKKVVGISFTTEEHNCIAVFLFRLISKKKRKRGQVVLSVECSTTGDLLTSLLDLERDGDPTQMLLEVLFMFKLMIM